MIVDLPEEEFSGQGNAGCRGYGAAIAARQTMKALGKRTIVTVPASCLATRNTRTAWKVPFYHINRQSSTGDFIFPSFELSSLKV